MVATVDITEVTVLTALRAVMMGWLPATIEVIRTEINQVPEPRLPNYITMTPTSRTRLATDIITYAEDGTTTMLVMPTQFDTRVEVHGPLAADMSQMLATLLRSYEASNAFKAINPGIWPLDCEDPQQTPFLNAQNAVEFRWTFNASLQANPTVTVPGDGSATVIVPGQLIIADDDNSASQVVTGIHPVT